jgi:hypothetical protein
MASENPYPTTYGVASENPSVAPHGVTSEPAVWIDTPEGFADLAREDDVLQVQADVATLAAQGFLEVTAAEDGTLAYRLTEWGLALLA